MKKHIWICSLIVMAIAIVACKKDSNNDSGPVQLKMLGWAVGGSDVPDNTYGTILHTADGGKTWIIQGDSIRFPNASFGDICIIDKNTLLVVGSKKPDGIANVLKSVDGGTNWVAVGNKSLENVNYLGIFSLNKDHIWIVGDSGTIYHSDDIASSWTKIEVPEAYRKDIFTRVAAKSIDNIWVVGNKHEYDDYPVMLHTTDAGTTWERLNPIKDLNITNGFLGYFLGIKTYGNSVWAIGSGFVVLSKDNGVTWSNISSSLTGPQDANDIFLLSGIEAYVVYDYGGILSTSDTGQFWTQYYPNTNNYVTGISILNNINIWVCGSPGGSDDYPVILYSPDAGTTWQDQTPQILKDYTIVTMYKIRFIEDN